MLRSSRLTLPVMALVLSAISFLSIYSLSYNGTDQFKNILVKQAHFTVTGIFACLIIGNFRHTIFIKYSKLFYALILAMLIGLLVYGSESRGAKAWVKFYFAGQQIGIQPSEFVKVALVLIFASSFRHSMEWHYRFLYYLVITIIPVFLIAIQPDLGLATIILSFFIAIVFTSVITSRSHAILIVMSMVIGSSILYGFALKDYHRKRFLGFLDMKESGNFQQFNSVKLISYGGAAGRGIDSISIYSPLYVPDRHNDFLFSCVGEGFGMIGSLAVILIFIMFVYKLFVISSELRDVVAGKLVLFSAIYFALQGFINIAVNLGLIPVVGINMPFFGSGGSSTLSCYMLLGIILSVLNRPLYSFNR